MSAEVRQWIDTVTGPGWFWYVKRLSGNDTLLNQSHQAGLYVPRTVAFHLFPSLEPSEENPRAQFAASIDSHNIQVMPTIIWYNNRLRAGTRNECRITGWGGQASPLLDPEVTGAICVFAFEKEFEAKDAALCCVWLCSTPEEEDAIEDRVGPVEPGLGFFYNASGTVPHPVPIPKDSGCWLKPDEIPADWRISFPEAAKIVGLSVDRLPTARKQDPDQRLLRRRECEYSIFRSVEDVTVKPRIDEGFATVDLFVDFANSVTNRRKSRAGLSLELHAKTIFHEEGLPHDHDEVSEGSKRPDFLFPSVAAYHDLAFPTEKLRMLAAKTTCKDRWRQILNEANRLRRRFLLTVQEGISPKQFAEMEAEHVTLVVPSPLHATYLPQIRPKLLTLDQFIKDTRETCS